MPSTKVPSKGLRLVNACANDVSDDDSHSLDAPPIYHTNVLPPSYSSRHGHQSPAAPRQQISAHSATPSSSPTGAVSAYTGLGSPHPSMHDSEVTCVSDNTGQSYRETASVFRSGSVGERDTAPTDDIGLSPRDSVSRIASISGIQEPRYIYYQVYLEGEAIHAKTSFTETDPFLGRIIARRIAPPHTAASIKRYLSKQEHISDYSRTILFSALSSPSPLEDHSHVSILTVEGPGSSLEDPMALVISDPPTQAIASLSAPALTLHSFTPSSTTVHREPNAQHVVGNGQPIVTQINHGPSKEEIKWSETEEKKRKEGARGKTRQSSGIAIGASLFYGAR